MGAGRGRKGTQLLSMNETIPHTLARLQEVPVYRSYLFMLILCFTLTITQLRNVFKPEADECLILETRDNGICQSHVSVAASSEMGECGGGRP